MAATPRRTTWFRIGLSALALALYGAHAFRFSTFLADDALISLQYTKRLLAGAGLTWCDGNLVEGYSNLLWVLLCAVPGLLHVDLIFGARVLGFLGMGAVVLALMSVADDHKRPAWFPASIFFALSGPVAVWTFGGLEGPLYAGLLAWILVLSFRIIDAAEPARSWIHGCSFLLGLLALTRPDGPLFTVGLVAALLLVRGIRKPTILLAARLVSLPFVMVAGQLVFRLAYYGQWVPNTALVKIGFSWHRLAEGAAYLGSGVWALLELSLLAVALMILALTDGKRRGRAVILLSFALLWCAYIVFVGGDIFEAFRHLIPLIVVLVFGLLVGLQSLSSRLHHRAAHVAVLVGVVLMASSFGWRQFNHPEIVRAADNRHVWYGQGIATTLKQAFGDDDPLLAVSAAGCFPYWTGFRCLDMLGLNDRHIARARPEDFGTGPLAPELGDADYLLDRLR